MSDSWKLILPCTRKEAEALNDDVPALALLDPQPVILTQEIAPDRPTEWEVVAYFEGKPDKAAIALIQSLIASAEGAKPVLEKLPDEDWVTMSQQAIQPVQAGRFFVHTSAFDGKPPAGCKTYLIEASQAFGTGGHETTSGCLTVLDAMKRRGQRFRNILDVGTGTGLLAFAARHLWPLAQVTASDIDPISIDVSMENAHVNHIPVGGCSGAVDLYVASGVDHPALQARGPYDLIIANILAGPLIELAPGIVSLLEEGGTVILAGLLDTQADAVAEAYRAQGMRLAARRDNGNWPCLRLVKRPQYGWQRPVRTSGRTSQPPGDFGTW
jgi:ribosomal protein L11 methyltransferase